MSIESNNLLLELIADPDDLDARLVYGDCLLADGDPVGELIALQHACEGEGVAATALDAERTFREENFEALIGHELFEFTKTFEPWQDEPLTVRWRRGFFERARLGRLATVDSTMTEAHAFLSALLRCERAWLLRELVLAVPSFARDIPFAEQTGAFLEAHLLPRLRRLQVGDFITPRTADKSSWSSRDISAVYLGDMSLIWLALPHLEEIELQGNNLILGDPSLAHLRSFSLYSSGCSTENLEALAGAKLPALERLILWLGAGEYGGEHELDSVLNLIEKPMPQLRELALANSLHSNEICAHLANSALAEQLTSLDLSLGVLNSVGARLLTREALPNLEELWVHRSYLTSADVVKLEQSFPAVHAAEQREPRPPSRYSETGRYISVSE